MQTLLEALRIGWSAYKSLVRGDQVELISLPQTFVEARGEVLKEVLGGWSEKQFYDGAIAIFQFIVDTELVERSQFFLKKPDGHIKPMCFFGPKVNNVIPFPVPPKN